MKISCRLGPLAFRPPFCCILFLSVNKLLTTLLSRKALRTISVFNAELLFLLTDAVFFLFFFLVLFFIFLPSFCSLFFVAVPVYEVSGISGESVRLPCNISIAEGLHHEEDNVVLVLWYREDLGTPIYR